MSLLSEKSSMILRAFFENAPLNFMELHEKTGLEKRGINLMLKNLLRSDLILHDAKTLRYQITDTGEAWCQDNQEEKNDDAVERPGPGFVVLKEDTAEEDFQVIEKERDQAEEEKDMDEKIDLFFGSADIEKNDSLGDIVRLTQQHIDALACGEPLPTENIGKLMVNIRDIAINGLDTEL
jgi:hypothetical protein